MSMIETINNATYIIVNDFPIRTNTREHFSKGEIAIIVGIYPSFDEYRKKCYNEKISFYEDVNNLKNREEIAYALTLALFQRITLPFEYVVNNLVYPGVYKLASFTDLFSVCEEKFEDIYNQVYYLRSQNNISNTKWNTNSGGSSYEHKERIYEQIKRVIIEFWLSGYGIKGKLNNKIITEKELSMYSKITPGKAGFLQATIILLNKILMVLPYSPVNTLIDVGGEHSIINSIKNRWERVNNQSDSEIYHELKQFSLSVLLERTTGPYELNYSDLEGTKKTEYISKITIGTWRDKNEALLNVINRLHQKGYLSIEKTINLGIQEVVSDIVIETRSRIQSVKTVLREWLHFYSKTHNKNLKINKIINNKMGRGNTYFGKTINFNAAAELIETLLDDQSPLHNDNHLSDFRYRRAFLLLLESGARIHEISSLKQDCLKTNKYHNRFLYFHKTKTNKNWSVPISSKAEKWIQQLKEVAPKEKILISKEVYGYGDDEYALRLFANSRNYAPLSPTTLRGYLKSLQKKLWGDNPPGGRYFTPHDFRRMCAVFLKLTGHSDEVIKERLGHENINSQLPYLLTKPKHHLDYFSEIYNDGLWGDTDKSVNETDPFYKYTSDVFHSNDESALSESIIKSFNKQFENIDIPNKEYLIENEATGGYPIRSHNCGAKAIVTCHHTEIKCFSCDYYKPDADKLNEHKAEILRWIIFLDYNSNLNKVSKHKFEKHKIGLKVEDTKKHLQTALKKLFQKYNLAEKDIAKLKKELYSKAKLYKKEYGDKKPSPTFIEAFEFYNKGVLNDET